MELIKQSFSPILRLSQSQFTFTHYNLIISTFTEYLKYYYKSVIKNNKNQGTYRTYIKESCGLFQTKKKKVQIPEYFTGNYTCG